MAHWRQDVQFGFRTLRHNPAFTAAAALVLALGIGANTALFSVADAFLFKPLPEIGRLLVLMERRAGTRDWNLVAPANFADWQA